MTDQELADAIRAEFADLYQVYTGSRDKAAMDFGYAVADFCTEHPAWKPMSGGRAWWGQYSINVWTIGPDPVPTGHWVIKRPDGTLTTADPAGLEPERAA